MISLVKERKKYFLKFFSKILICKEKKYMIIYCLNLNVIV